MKIIKHGLLRTKKVYRLTCKNCDTEVEVTRDECAVTYIQRKGIFLYYPCPVCFTTISGADIPNTLY